MTDQPEDRKQQLSNLRPFPMQDGPPIPWFIAEAIYTHLYRSTGQTLERLAQRGGFGWAEVAYMWTGRVRSEDAPRHPYATNENRAAARADIRKVWPDA